MYYLFNERIYPVVIKFPKSEKFALSQDIKNCFLEYLTYVKRADEVKSMRLRYSQEAQAYLGKIKTLMSIAKSREYISIPFYESVSLELTEISKMLKAYIRKINKK